MFAALEHADEGGPSAAAAGASTSRAAAGQQQQQRPANAKQQGGKKKHTQASATSSSNRPANAAPQSARAEDYYRAFEHVYRDPGPNEVVLRFHKTKIVRIKPSGDFQLTSGGWLTATTVAALNDALQALGMKLTYQPPVSAGMWTLTDDSGAQHPFKDGIVIRASRPEHSQRGTRLLKAYNGGAEVPRYARKPPGTSATVPPRAPGAVAGAPAAAAGAAGARAPQQQQQHHAAATAAGPRAAQGDALEQLKAAMQEYSIADEPEESLCVVCIHRPRDEVLVPCGHMVLCSECCASVMASTNQCPMCREAIEDHCRIDPDDA